MNCVAVASSILERDRNVTKLPGDSTNKGLFVLIKQQETYYIDNCPLVISISSLNSILYKSPGITLQGLAGPKSELPPSLFRLINTDKYREILRYTEKY